MHVEVGETLWLSWDTAVVGAGAARNVAECGDEGPRLAKDK